MKLVIDIEDYDREYIVNDGYHIPDTLNWKIAKAIIDGKPLPEHHGRIIDESQITKVWYYQKKIEIGALIQPYIQIDHTDAPTIIESERE